MHLYDESATDVSLLLPGNALWNAPMWYSISQVGMQPLLIDQLSEMLL
jgi:hypothetical protein